MSQTIMTTVANPRNALGVLRRLASQPFIETVKNMPDILAQATVKIVTDSIGNYLLDKLHKSFYCTGPSPTGLV